MSPAQRIAQPFPTGTLTRTPASASLCPRLLAAAGTTLLVSPTTVQGSSEATEASTDLARGFSSSSFSSFLAEVDKILNPYLTRFHEQKALMLLKYSTKEEHTAECSPVLPRKKEMQISQCWGLLLNLLRCCAAFCSALEEEQGTLCLPF